MGREGYFTIHNYEIEFTKYGEQHYLLPFGDVHRYAPNCDSEKWLEYLDWAKNKKNAHFLGTGDYEDLMSYSERDSFMKCNFHESTKKSIEELYDERVANFTEEVKFMKGKIIGLIEGNHYGTYFNYNITTTQKLAQNLNCRYLGNSAFIRIIFKSSMIFYSFFIRISYRNDFFP